MKTSGSSLAAKAKKHNESIVNLHTTLIRNRDGVEKPIEFRRTGAPLWVASSREETFATNTTVHQPLYSKKWSPFVVEVPYDTPVGGFIKRAFDLLIATTTIFLMAPIMLTIALLIYLTQGGPVIFVQQRVGFNRRMFGCLKFRTMVPNADEKLTQYLATNEEASRIWQENQKLKHDPRVTWLGHVLRKSSLDELPQLFNVLKGDMSCIGPRPVVADELQRYGVSAQDYLKARPGLTGMWQVNGRSNTTYEYRVNCDRYYVRRWSFMLDMSILVRTVPAVMKFDETA